MTGTLTRNLLLSLLVVTVAFVGRVGAFDTESYQGKQVVSKRVLVKFADNISAGELNNVLGKIGGSNQGSSGGGAFTVVDLTGDTTIDTALQALASETSVVWAEPDYVQRLFFAPVIPMDTNFVNQYYLDQVSDVDLDAPEAWGRMNSPGGRRTIVVGVLDSGAQMSHPDLVNNFYQDVGDPIDGIDNDGDGYVDELNGFDFIEGVIDDNGTPDNLTDDKWTNSDTGPEDLNGHGTQVSSVIAASINDTNQIQSIVGVAYNVKVFPIKVCDAAGNCPVSSVAAGMYFAARHEVDIVNASLGGAEFSQAQKDANSFLLDQKIIPVIAAGNDGSDLNTSDVYPAEYFGDNIVVGSVGKTGDISDFSNFGGAIDVVAFGEEMFMATINGYTISQGTSFASPIVAGAAALLLSENPSLDRSEIDRILKTTAIDRGSPGRDDKYGDGIINLVGALKMVQFGTRRDEQIVTYPNPFRINQGGFCVIEPTAAVTNLNVNIYTLSGKLVRRLDGANEIADFDSDGSVEARWDGRNEGGEKVVPGVYIAAADILGQAEHSRITVISW